LGPNLIMRTFKNLIITIFTGVFFLSAQESDPIVVGVGVNSVDNSGSRFSEVLNVKENWNFSRLLRITVEKRYDFDYGVIAALSMNKFNVGKTINSEENKTSLGYLSLDIMFKNYTTNYFLDPKHAKYEGFVAAGLGANLIGSELAKTINLGLGINLYLDFDLRLNLQTVGKFSIDSATSGNANHIQHSITLIKWIGQNQK